MAKRRRKQGSQRSRRGSRWPAGNDRPRGARPSRSPVEPGLLRDASERMATPLDLLTMVSSLLAVVDPREHDPFAKDDRHAAGPTRGELLQSFIGVEQPETSALLAAAAALSPDDAEQRMLRRHVEARAHPLPDWLGSLGAADAYCAVKMTHVLGDGENVMVGVRLPTGHELSAVLYVDHNLGTVAKDGFVVEDPIDDLVAFMRTKSADPDMAWQVIEPADARARMTEAIDRGAMIYPRLETDTWPAARAVVEWVARLLPEGGTGFTRPDWPEPARRALAARFLASPLGAALNDPDMPELLDNILWFGCDYGPGDPLRWSPTAVEIILGDWIPRKILAEVEYLAKAPEILRAFIRFCHAERDIRPELTDQTLAAVDEWENEYLRVIRSSRPQGPAALLATLGLLDDRDDWSLTAFRSPEFDALMLRGLEEAVGGADVLGTLHGRPLPDEPLDLSGVPADIEDRIAEVSALCDGFFESAGDTELRTAARRFLAAVAEGDPSVFRRRARSDTAAAAVCWIIGKANDLFRPFSGGMQVRHLTDHFGLGQGGASQRAATLLRAAGLRGDTYGEISLGSPRYLTSSRRRAILEQRDEYQS